MSISFVTPAAGLVVLVGLVPLLVLAVSRLRLRGLCIELGLAPPSSWSALPTALALVAVAALLALAAASPVAARRTTHAGRADVEVFFVFDTSRSMGARGADSPTRLDRARSDAKTLRAELADLPVGVASVTDRLLPHLFPSMSVNAFNGTLDESLGIDRPTMSFDYGNTLGTKLGALTNVVDGRYFHAEARRRVVVVFTDGETRPDDLSLLPARLADGNIHVLFFRYWNPTERVYDVSGRIIPAYQPDQTSTERMTILARTMSAPLLDEGRTGDAASRIRKLVGSGPMAERGRDLDSLLLTPYVVVLALVPLAFLLRRSGTQFQGRLRGDGST